MRPQDGEICVVEEGGHLRFKGAEQKRTAPNVVVEMI